MEIRSLLFLYILTLSSFAATAQQLKKIKHNSGTGYSNLREVYYVIKDSPKIKHGSYEYYAGDNLEISGFYFHGIRDSVWRSYSRDQTISKRVYNKGNRSGVWENRNAKGELTYTYDFNAGKATEYIKDKGPETVHFLIQMPDGNWGDDALTTPPVKLLTTYTWQVFLMRNLRYPIDAIKNGIQGQVIVDMIFDETGHAIDYKIESDTNPLLNDEALRVIKLFDFEFLPAEKDGKKVKFLIRQPISFRTG